MFRFLVWIFGLLFPPMVAGAALQKCAQDHGHKFGDEVIKAVVKLSYVDDIMRSMAKLLSLEGFRLTKMVSNSAIPKENRATGVFSVDESLIGEDSALGMLLDLKKDIFRPAFDDKF